MRLYTVNTALEALKKYHISETDLSGWEEELNLDIPVDAYGRKQYSPHHVNLFKNIKKHITLGRTLDEIKRIVSLPPLEQSKENTISETQQNPNQELQELPLSRLSEASPPVTSQFVVTKSPYATTPHLPNSTFLNTSTLNSSSFNTPPVNISQSPEQGGNLPSTMPTLEAQTHETQAPPNMPSQSQPEPKMQETKTFPDMQPSQPQSRNPAPDMPPTQNNQSNTFRPVSTGTGAANVIHLVERLNHEKDQLYKKLLETEKLNSHLYSANTLFHKKVREMTDQVRQLRQNFNEDEKIKLMDDKAKLHKQLIDAEKLNQYKQEEILNHKLEGENLRHQIQGLDKRIQALSTPFNADKFCGNWMETGHLLEVSYDNFGVNIEAERVRLFRISEKPSRIYGAMAIIYTSYQYETNSLWKRHENLFVTYIDEQTLDGELSAEYILDGVPVAKALYRVTCRRSQ